MSSSSNLVANFTSMVPSPILKARKFDEAKYKYLYNNLERYFLSWYLPLIVIVGTLGGVFCIVFLMTPRLFPRHILLWMVAICIGDLMSLHTDALRMAVKVLLRYDLRDTYLVMCRGHNFLSNYFLYWSGYMQTSISLQRLYFVLYPLRARTFVSQKFVIICIVSISLGLIFPLLPYLLVWKPNPQNHLDCEPERKEWYKVTTLIDFFIWGLIPLFGMTLSTILISCRMFQWTSKNSCHHVGTSTWQCPLEGDSIIPSNELPCFLNVPTPLHKFKNAQKDFPVQTPPSERKSFSNPAIIGTTTRTCHRGQRHGHDNAWQVTRLLIGMNCFYMLSMYPLLIYLMILNFVFDNKVGETIPQQVHKFLYYLLRSICYLSCTFNWVFYCAAGKLFREHAHRLLRRMCCRMSLGDISQMEMASIRAGMHRSLRRMTQP